MVRALRLSRLPLALALAVFSAEANATRVQWLQPDLPPEEIRLQAERTTGPATHLDVSEIGWPAEVDAHQAAQAAQAGLRAAVAEGRKRWETFDIERDMTWRLGEAVDSLRLVESEEDREALYQALLLQGAAAFWAWAPGQRARLPEVQPLLVELGNERLFAPWVDAVALFPEREPRRADLPDQTTWQAFVHVREVVRNQRTAELTAVGLPVTAVLYVDGRPIQTESLPLALTPGRHWLHVEHGGLVSGARSPRLGPGERFDLDGLVPASDISRATEKVLAGDLLEVPASVQHRIEALRAETPEEPYYLAAWSGHGAPRLYAITGAGTWTQGEYDRPVSLVAAFGLGAGIAGSSAFQEAPMGESLAVPATVLGLSTELGWRRWGVQLELAVHDTASKGTIVYGEAARHVNQATSSFARISVAPTFHVLRLRPRRPDLMLAVPVGVLTPAHQGVGLQAWYGLPLGPTTWLRAGGGFWSGSLRAGFEPADGVDGKFGLITLQVGICQKVL